MAYNHFILTVRELSKWLSMKLLLLCLTVTGLALAQTRAPSLLWVRSQAEWGSKHSAPGSRVEAMVVQDYVSPTGFVVPIGSRVNGKVVAASARKNASLRMEFDSVAVAGREFALQAHISAVDNAREVVTADGTILALDRLRKRPGKVELILLAAAYAHPAVLASVEGGKYVVREVRPPEVAYPVGTDYALALEVPPTGSSNARVEMPEPQVAEGIAELLATLPNRTTTTRGAAPADWINIAFVGSKERVERAFQVAGWIAARQLSIRADMKTFLAVAASHSYQEAPVSALWWSNRAPDLVYQKQTNTFAKRHHIRIWQAGVDPQGEVVWLAACTHDVGIEFSRATRSFMHRIDSNIDNERLKVLGDLRVAGQVSSWAYVSRPAVPAQSKNATGDAVNTDGRLAVVQLGAPPSPTNSR